LKATQICIWTDVSGVLSADPRRVPGAGTVPEVSYNEAMELAYFGAKVIHPKTMQPAISSDPQIPIYIRNTFESHFRGTRIYTSSSTHTEPEKCVCGFSSIDNMALINVEGSGLIGVHGVAKREFSIGSKTGR
jgi:aspartokinase/homoserine dehydrogenase 1